jgi:hypothetical protein
MIFAFDSTKRSAVLYPCRAFQLLNFVCIVPDSSLKEATAESWSATGDRDELVALFADFPPWVLQGLEYVVSPLHALGSPYSSLGLFLLILHTVELQKTSFSGNFATRIRSEPTSGAIRCWSATPHTQ